MRSAILAAFFIATTVSGAYAQAAGIAEYDLQDLDSIAAHRQLDLRGVLARATRRDTGALRVVLMFAEPADSAALAASRGYPALLWSLLTLWGDRTFAGELDLLLPEAKPIVLAALDRGAGLRYADAFPRTWSLGPHDSTLLGPGMTMAAASDSSVEARIYPPARLHRLPAAEVGSCRPLVYPPALLDRGVAGRAVVEMVVDSAGVTREAALRAVAATHAAFAAAAEEQMRTCRYRPARRAGRPVATIFRVPVLFAPESVLIRTGTITNQVLAAFTVQPFAEAAGISYAQALTAAGRGDGEALRTLLGLVDAIDPAQPAARDYVEAIETLMHKWGDRAFATAAATLPDEARAKLAGMLDFQREDMHDFPLTAVTLPPAHAAPTAEFDTAGTRDADAPGIEPARARAGTCRLPTLPGDQNVTRFISMNTPVTVEIVIDREGRVDRRATRVVLTPSALFNDPARDAAASCRYHPARLHGEAIPVRLQLPVVFSYRRQLRTR
jgi:TonB family protein